MKCVWVQHSSRYDSSCGIKGLWLNYTEDLVHCIKCGKAIDSRKPSKMSEIQKDVSSKLEELKKEVEEATGPDSYVTKVSR